MNEYSMTWWVFGIEEVKLPDVEPIDSGAPGCEINLTMDRVVDGDDPRLSWNKEER